MRSLNLTARLLAFYILELFASSVLRSSRDFGFLFVAVLLNLSYPESFKKSKLRNTELPNSYFIDHSNPGDFDSFRILPDR